MCINSIQSIAILKSMVSVNTAEGVTPRWLAGPVQSSAVQDNGMIVNNPELFVRALYYNLL